MGGVGYGSPVYIRQGPLPASAFLFDIHRDCSTRSTMPGTAFTLCVWILREHGERERGCYRRVQYTPRMSGSMCSLCAVWQCAQPVTQTWRDNMSVPEPAAIAPLCRWQYAQPITPPYVCGLGFRV